jgi:hypothetical protein
MQVNLNDAEARSSKVAQNVHRFDRMIDATKMIGGSGYNIVNNFINKKLPTYKHSPSTLPDAFETKEDLQKIHYVMKRYQALRQNELCQTKRYAAKDFASEITERKIEEFKNKPSLEIDHFKELEIDEGMWQSDNELLECEHKHDSSEDSIDIK